MTAFIVVCLILLGNYGSNGRELSRGREESERHYWNEENIRSKPSYVKDYIEEKSNRVGDPLRPNRFNLKSDGSDRSKWFDYEEENWKGMGSKGKESGVKFLNQEIRKGGGESRLGFGRDEVRTLTTENPGLFKSLLRMETGNADLDLDKDDLGSLSVFAKLQPHGSIMTDKGFTLLEKLKILKESMDEGASRLSSYAKDFKDAVNNYIVTTYPTEFDNGNFKEFSSYKKMSQRPNVFMATHAIHTINGSLDSTNWFSRLNKTDQRKLSTVELPQAASHNPQSKCSDSYLHELFEKLKKCPFVFDACMNLKTPLDSEYPIAGENKIHLTVKLDSLFNILEMITKIMKEASEKGGPQEGGSSFGFGDWNKKQPSTANPTTAKYPFPKTLYVQPESPKQMPTTLQPTMFIKVEKDVASSSYSSSSVSSTTPIETNRLPNSQSYSNDTVSAQKPGLVNRKPNQMLRRKFVNAPINTSQHKLQKAPSNDKTLISRPRIVDYELVNDGNGTVSRKKKRDSKEYYSQPSFLEQDRYHSSDKADKLGLNTIIDDIIKNLGASNSRSKKSSMFDVRSSRPVSSNEDVYLMDDRARNGHTKRFKTKEEGNSYNNNESKDPIISGHELNNLVQPLKDNNTKHLGNMFKRSLGSVENYNYELTPDICRLNNKKTIRKKRCIDSERENLKRILENMKKQSLVQQNRGSAIHLDSPKAFPVEGFENVINISQNLTASEPLSELVHRTELNEGMRVKRSTNEDNSWYPEDIHYDEKTHLLKNALFGDSYSGGKGDQSNGVIDALSPKVIWSASEPPPKDLRDALKSGLSPVVLPPEENSYQTDLNLEPAELRKNEEINDEREFLDQSNGYNSKYRIGLRVKKNPSCMSENRDWSSLMRRSYPHAIVEQEDQELLSPLQMDYDLNHLSGWNAKRQAANFPHGWPESNEPSVQAGHLGSVYGPISDSYMYPLSGSYSSIPWQNPMHRTRCKKECDSSNQIYPSLECSENKEEASLEGFLRGVDQFRTHPNHEGNNDPNTVADTLSNGSIMTSFTELANRIADKVKPHSRVRNFKNPSNNDIEKETRRKKRFVLKTDFANGRDDFLQKESSKINYNMEDVEDVINTAVSGERATAEEIDRKMRKLNKNFFSKQFENANEDSPSEGVDINNEIPAVSSDDKLREKLKISEGQSNDGGSPVFDGSGSTPSDISSQGTKSVNNTLKTIKSGNKSNLYKSNVNEFYETEDNSTQKYQMTKKPEEQFWSNKSDELINGNESGRIDPSKLIDPFNLTNYNGKNLEISDSRLREIESDPKRQISGGDSRKTAKIILEDNEPEDYSPVHHDNGKMKLNEMSEEIKKENKYDSFEVDEQNNSDSRESEKTDTEDSDSEGQELSLGTLNSGSINSKKVGSVLSEMAGDVKSLSDLTKQLQFSQKKTS